MQVIRFRENTQGEFTNEDVNLERLGGKEAQFAIVNSAVSSMEGSQHVANLTVINKNTVLPLLRAEPFCDDSFMGRVTGFRIGR